MVEVKVPLNSAVRLISPRVTALITTIDKQGRVNAAPYSWIYPISYKPPLVGIGVGGKHKHTYINAKEAGEFVINIVSEGFAQRAVNCEEQHKPGEDLLAKHNLRTSPSEKTKAPRVRESKAVLECRLRDIIEVKDSDHVILVGEVVAAESAGGLEEIRPLLHDSGKKFRSVGKEIVLSRRK